MGVVMGVGIPPGDASGDESHDAGTIAAANGYLALFLPVSIPLPAGPVTGLDTVGSRFGSSSDLLDECKRPQAELPDDPTVLDSLTDQERERVFATDMCGRLILAARRSTGWGAAPVISWCADHWH